MSNDSEEECIVFGEFQTLDETPATPTMTAPSYIDALCTSSEATTPPTTTCNEARRRSDQILLQASNTTRVFKVSTSNTTSVYTDPNTTRVSGMSVDVDNAHIGAILGKEGANAAQIRSQSGASVNIQELQPGQTMRRIDIIGTSAQAQAAKVLIQNCIADESLCATQREHITVDNDNIGSILGKGGVNVAQIRSKSGAAVKIHELQTGHTIGSSISRTIDLTGTPEQIQVAKALIHQFMADDQPSSPPSSPSPTRQVWLKRW